MSLNVKQSEVMKQVIAGKNMFISGPGGVGKSYLIKEIMNRFSDSTILMAPTGIAALNIGGATVHSVFKFPLGILTKTDHNNVKDKVMDLFDKQGPVKRIIIDEIPMVRADIFQAIDMQLRRARRLKHVPFGGIQVIVVGDFYQLPPVVTNREKKHFFSLHDSPFAFGGETWSSASFNYTELDEIMRQTDNVFIGHLQKVRRRESGFEKSVEFFNRWASANTEAVLEHDPVFLCTTNATAESLNNENYDSLEGEEHHFRGQISGKFPSRPSPEHLLLKYGAKVLFTANDRDEMFKNGETGYVTGFIGDKIKVLKETDETEVLVSKYTWEERDYVVSDGGLQSFPTGKFVQYPLKLGWAVTIHKSQGMTLDNAVIEMGRGAFASGQTYVALSRLRALEGMGLMGNIANSDIIVAREVQEFYENGCKGIGLGL